jgi:hypothetical protein
MLNVPTSLLMHSDLVFYGVSLCWLIGAVLLESLFSRDAGIRKLFCTSSFAHRSSSKDSFIYSSQRSPFVSCVISIAMGPLSKWLKFSLQLTTVR